MWALLLLRFNPALELKRNMHHFKVSPTHSWNMCSGSNASDTNLRTWPHPVLKLEGDGLAQLSRNCFEKHVGVRSFSFASSASCQIECLNLIWNIAKGNVFAQWRNVFVQWAQRISDRIIVLLKNRFQIFPEILGPNQITDFKRSPQWIIILTDYLRFDLEHM